MPSLTQNSSTHAAVNALAAASLDSPQSLETTHFGVVPFRRDATGAIVPGAAVPVPNGDIAWRRARAEAFDHGNVGAVVLTDGAFTGTGRFEGGVLIAQFGEVSLDALQA